jgi:hypothetical protein
MSDYLWDKTGEPDAEVERLEALLGAFGHAPRALELPASSATPAPRPSRLFGLRGRLRTSSLFAPVGLAAAAALLLAFLIGAATLLRARVATEEKASAVGDMRQTGGGAEKDVASPPPERTPRAPEPGSREREMKAGGMNDEKDAVTSPARGPLKRKVVQVAAVPRRQRSEPVAHVGGGASEVVAVEAMSAGGGTSAFVESTRLLTKEQLVYALRLTGAKLRDVRERAQGLDGAKSPPR